MQRFGSTTCNLLTLKPSNIAYMSGHRWPQWAASRRPEQVSQCLSVAGRQPPWAVVTMSSPLLSTLSSLSTLISLVLVGTQHTYCYDYSVYATSTGCCKTSGKLWKHIIETLYGVFFVFLGPFDCQIWAIFHFGTLWTYGWKKSWKIWPWKKARYQGWLKLANFLIS